VSATLGRSAREARWRLLVLALVLAFPLPALGQKVAGRVRDAASRAPVEGALVLLFDASGARVAGTLTDGRGSFGLEAPGGGRYTVQAERIGYGTVTSEAFALAAHDVHTLDLLASAMPVSLEGLEVEGSKRCVVRPEEGAALSRVWGEARKALRNQAWTDETGSVRFRLRRYERSYDAGMRMVTDERVVSEGWTTGNPIRSLDAWDLIENGFVRPTDDGGHEYFGPDASVLLSDAFLDTHCFKLAAAGRDPELVGLAFEPIRGRRVPDITGTFWLTRADARLRALEFVYTSSPWPEAAKVAGGRVEFDELPTGPWVVRRWWIRMPRMERDLGLMVGGRSGLRVGGIVEVGGTATQVGMARGGGRARESGRIEGIVWDSTRGAPLASATVTTADGVASGVTDVAGRFVLEDVPYGVTELAFRHPRMDSLPTSPPPVIVHVMAGGAPEVALAVPSLAAMLDATCGDLERPEGSAVVLGRVAHADTGDPLPGAVVTLEWKDYQVVAASEVKADVRGLRVGTDPHGRYRACGIPPGVELTVRASSGDVDGPVRRMPVPRDGMVVLDLRVRPRQPRS